MMMMMMVTTMTKTATMMTTRRVGEVTEKDTLLTPGLDLPSWALAHAWTHTTQTPEEGMEKY